MDFMTSRAGLGPCGPRW